MKKLKVGDKVICKGGWGSQPPLEVIVEAIYLCPKGSMHGREVKSVLWNTVLGNGIGQVVVILNNGHWAYGTQLTQI